ncbi:MAG TPA: DinB family protein [Gemmatimonadaceae bacterium]|nr:DinB family protein [Gemmatimonadaceae bacterium]
MPVAQQLESLRAELRESQSAIASFAARVSDQDFSRRPPSGGWSAAECIAHLTLTTEGYIPLLSAARRKVPEGTALPSAYKMGFGAWLLWWILKPPARGYSRSRTLPAFVPGSAAPKAATLAAFDRSQEALLAWIASVERAPLNHMMLTSPFNEKMKYNAYGALRVIAVHQQRHIWQAERAARGIP